MGMILILFFQCFFFLHLSFCFKYFNEVYVGWILIWNVFEFSRQFSISNCFDYGESKTSHVIKISTAVYASLNPDVRLEKTVISDDFYFLSLNLILKFSSTNPYLNTQINILNLCKKERKANSKEDKTKIPKNKWTVWKLFFTVASQNSFA